MKRDQARRRTLWRMFGFLGPWGVLYWLSLVGVAITLTTERTFIAYVVKLFVDSVTENELELLWRSVQVWGLFLVGWIPLNILLSWLWRSQPFVSA